MDEIWFNYCEGLEFAGKSKRIRLLTANLHDCAKGEIDAAEKKSLGHNE